MNYLKTIMLVGSLLAGSSLVASAEGSAQGGVSAPGGVNARDGNGTTTGTMRPDSNTPNRGSMNNGSMMQPVPSTNGMGDRALETPSDPAAIGTSGRDKHSGAPKDKD